MKFNEIFKELRKDNLMNQEKLALLLNTTRSTISDWENKRSEPNIEQLNNIANYFNCTVDYLIGREENIEAKTQEKIEFSNKEKTLLKYFSLLDNDEKNKLIEDCKFFIG